MSRRIHKPVSGDDRFPAIVRYFLVSRDTPALKSPESMKEHLRLFNELYCMPKYEAAAELNKIDDLVDNPEKYVPTKTVAQVSIGATCVEETPSTKSLNEENYRFPAECLEGDRLCDLAHELTDGTFIPPQFAHADLQVWTGHALDGRIEPPGSSFLDFSTRFFVNKFSYHPQTGKGESWDRVKWSFSEVMQPRPMESLVNSGDIYCPTVIDGTQWGSGPFMISQLAETPNCICWMDEGSGMWLTKAPTDQKAIENAFLTFFEKHEHGTGSFKNKKFVASNVHLSMNACFTLNSFTESYQGRGSGGSGFLSRVLLVFGTKILTNGQPWPDYKQTKARMIADEMADIMATPPSLSITPEAQSLSIDFQKWLEKEDQHFTGRVGYYFNKDALLRATFSGGVVTADVVRRSIRWAQEQLNLRKRFWPIDAATSQGILEFKILSQFETSDTLLTDRTLQQALHIGKRDGKFSARDYNFAREALLKSGQLERAGDNRKGNSVYKRRPQ
jgi:hypothetical protein